VQDFFGPSGPPQYERRGATKRASFLSTVAVRALSARSASPFHLPSLSLLLRFSARYFRFFFVFVFVFPRLLKADLGL
jgi:hypothetical protein